MIVVVLVVMFVGMLNVMPNIKIIATCVVASVIALIKILVVTTMAK